MKINYEKMIWEGWTVQDFIDDLEPQLTMIMYGQSWQAPFTTKEDLKKWCADNQPYYKKPISGRTFRKSIRIKIIERRDYYGE